jgi:hypothetical protein
VASSELSLIRFNVLNFHHLIMTTHQFQPVFTKLLKIVNALINSEPQIDEEVKTRLIWIKDHTHEKIDLPISQIEYAVFNNMPNMKNFSREIDIKNRSFNLIFLYKVLDDISFELTDIVINIAKKYSIDMPFITNYGTAKTTIEV